MPNSKTLAQPLALIWFLFVFASPLLPAYGKSEESPKTTPKHANVSFTPRFLYPGGEVVMSVDTLTLPEERVMALTFDDGPDERDLEITALLKKHDIPAAFFYIGRKIKQFPEVVKEVHASKYEIGYHSFRHQRVNWFSQENQTSDFRQGMEALTSLGVSPTLFRPPYGEFNDRLVHTAKENGMETVLWTIDSRDWTGIAPETMAKNVIRQFHPGAVLLFHSPHINTLRALPLVLAAAERENYRFVSLGDWRQTVRAANCRKEGRLPCPSTPVVAARHPVKSVGPAKSVEPTPAARAAETPNRPARKPAAAKPPAQTAEPNAEPDTLEERHPVALEPEPGESEEDAPAMASEVPSSTLTRVVEPLTPALTPISVVNE
ncbi:MAG: polysaccharide deacetylase family protein [Magnetococcales bacterium]|nr:polysaccharide deacetylase family protein [Magnetococcales bacterium]